METVKYLIILILLFDGNLVKEKLEFERPMTVSECFDFADGHREAIAEFNEDKNTWFLKDRKGTWQGFICSN